MSSLDALDLLDVQSLLSDEERLRDRVPDDDWDAQTRCLHPHYLYLLRTSRSRMGEASVAADDTSR